MNAHKGIVMLSWKTEEWLRERYWNEGLSLREIGELVGVSPATVSKQMEKLGVERRIENKNRPLKISHLSAGYELIQNEYGGDRYRLLLHRLLAVSEWGFDAVAGNEVHHRNGIPWDNRPSNIEVVSKSEHKDYHRDTYKNKRTPWRDEDTLRELYEKRGLTGEQVAEELGCSSGTAYNWLREFDLIS